MSRTRSTSSRAATARSSAAASEFLSARVMRCSRRPGRSIVSNRSAPISALGSCSTAPREGNMADPAEAPRRLRGATWPVARSLDRIPVVASLPDAVRRDMEKRCIWKEYKNDEQIIDRESENRDVFFVVGGKVRIVNYSYSGRE